MIITVVGVVDGIFLHVEDHPEIILTLDFPYLFRQKVIANVERLSNGIYTVHKYFGLEKGEDLSIRYVADQIFNLEQSW